MDLAKRYVLPMVADVVAAKRPTAPIQCLRPHVLKHTSCTFTEKFPGTVLYSVKCNPHPQVVRAVRAGGIRHFDAASLSEIFTLRQLIADAVIHFMHPLKPRLSIRAAYTKAAVRDFALDSIKELDKIVEETEAAKDLGLFIRLALKGGGAIIDLSDKFGASPEQAVPLLKAARGKTERLGICFHVGSQCMDPSAFTRAIDSVATILETADVTIDVINVGGGFPVSYPGLEPPSLDRFIDEISKATRRFKNVEVWCEPGRAIAASGSSLVVQVLDRREDRLFINDGIFGNLMDAGIHDFRYPARLIRLTGESQQRLMEFSFLGPTCDGNDRMRGPFMLPADIEEGDWIELGQLGAYSACMRTNFNGFGHTENVEVGDAPLLITPGYEEVYQAA